MSPRNRRCDGDERPPSSHDRPRLRRAEPSQRHLFKQRAFAPLIQAPRLAFFVAKRQVAVVELRTGPTALAPVPPLLCFRRLCLARSGPESPMGWRLGWSSSSASHPCSGLSRRRRSGPSNGSCSPAITCSTGSSYGRDLCTVGRDETLCQAAGRMLDHGIGAAIIESSKPKFPCAIISDRDVLATIGAGQDTEVERVGEHLSRKMTFSALGLVPQPGSRGNV